MIATELFNYTKNHLSNFTDESELETLIILDKLFSLKKLDIVMGKEVNTSSENLDLLEKILIKREKKIPLQYIFNEQFFRNYTFYVDERVLIPRPETELLVDKVIELSKTFDNEEISIVDVGVGSGAICISLALEISNSIVYGCDISKEALEIAKKNKNLLHVPENKLILKHSDKLEEFKNEKFDIIVSNPPYIPHEQYNNLETHVKEYEPELALKGINSDGLGFYEYLLNEGLFYLKNKGFLCCEFGYLQEKGIINLLEKSNDLEYFQILNDYSNIPRIFIARKK